MSKIQVGILGYGRLGNYLVDNILNNPAVSSLFELAFVHNRSVDKIHESDLAVNIPYILSGDVEEALKGHFSSGKHVDIIVEASHPDTIVQYGEYLLAHSSLFITSLTSLADRTVYNDLLAVSTQSAHSIYIPTGAGWGFEDVKKMSDANTLVSASIRMEFHADALKLHEPLRSTLQAFVKDEGSGSISLYKGPVRQLASLAPNNTNTMCGLALAAHNLGFDRVQAELIATKDSHIHRVQMAIEGPDGFQVFVDRRNPAQPKAVTGSMTFGSFLSSLIACAENGSGDLIFV